MATLRFPVPEEDSGSRLDRVLADRPEIASRAEAERLLATGAVTVGGAPGRKSRRLAAGEEVAVDLPEAVALEPAPIAIRAGR